MTTITIADYNNKRTILADFTLETKEDCITYAGIWAQRHSWAIYKVDIRERNIIVDVIPALKLEK